MIVYIHNSSKKLCQIDACSIYRYLIKSFQILQWCGDTYYCNSRFCCVTPNVDLKYLDKLICWADLRKDRFHQCLFLSNRIVQYSDLLICDPCFPYYIWFSIMIESNVDIFVNTVNLDFDKQLIVSFYFLGTLHTRIHMVQLLLVLASHLALDFERWQGLWYWRSKFSVTALLAVLSTTLQF